MIREKERTNERTIPPCVSTHVIVGNQKPTQNRCEEKCRQWEDEIKHNGRQMRKRIFFYFFFWVFRGLVTHNSLGECATVCHGVSRLTAYQWYEAGVG